MTIICLPAFNTSANSLHEHIEEPREVPESSMSSIFFRQEQYLVILKQYKIITDTQEINLQDHSLIYFDLLYFDLHLLFFLSIMTVSCSQTSNMLTLVHLLLSKSLFNNCLDEFEKIMYVVR